MIAVNKHSAKPKIWSLEMPNAPYLERWYALESITDSVKFNFRKADII